MNRSPALDVSHRVSVPLEIVWRVMASAEHRGIWWPEFVGHWRDSEAISVRDEAPGCVPRHADGHIDAVHENEFIRWSWRTRGIRDASVVTIRVSEAKDLTKIRVVEAGFSDSPAGAITIDQMRQYWRFRINVLSDYLKQFEMSIGE